MMYFGLSGFSPDNIPVGSAIASKGREGRSIGGLISFAFWDAKNPPHLQWRPFIREWILDSGAYSAFVAGKGIDLQALTETALALQGGAFPPATVFGLDVIGDPVLSRKNTEKMRAAGVDAVPTFHFGEPLEHLDSLAADYSEIAVGGMVGKPPRVVFAWLSSVLRRVWPRKVHGFGLARRAYFAGMPLHSVDSALWFSDALRFNDYQRFGYLRSRRPRAEINLGSNIDAFLEMEARSEVKWRKQLKQIRGKS